ncbi:hypothetical protein BH10PLA1_BH10PLA1_00820 [soil metagenome]
MSYSASHYDVTYEELVYAPTLPDEVAQSRVMPVLLGVSVAISLISWMGNGIPMLTDLSFIWLAAVCTLAVTKELIYFPKRLRIGSITLYGGVMVWYCHDYFTNWFGIQFDVITHYPASTVAKGAFYTSLFVFFASLGMMLPTGGWMEKRIAAVPEPRSNKVYGLLIGLTFLFGFSPFLFFNRDPFYIGVYKSITAMRGGEGAAWTVGRDGNLNYSWGGYLAQVLQVGDVGGIMAAFFAILVPTTLIAQILCMAIWLLWTLVEFGTGARGPFLFMFLPVVGLIWIKYSAAAIRQLQSYSKKALLYTGIAVGLMLFAVQIQGSFRGVGLLEADVSQVELFKNQGNSMFSESLIAYYWYPDVFPHPYNQMPGEGAISMLPKIAMRFAISWIPRALWNNKPGFDETSNRINTEMTGGSAENGRGGTIATSIAGSSYIYYGSAGVVEIGLLFGWLCRCIESSLRFSFGKAFAMMIVLGLATYMFRSFRDLTPHNLYPLLIGATVMILLHRVLPKS